LGLYNKQIGGVLVITKVEVNNFKQFESLSLERMSLINVIAGKNSSGKTTLLEAIFTNLGRLSADVFIRMFSWRGAEELEMETKTLIAPFFYKYDLSKTIQIKLYDEIDIRDLTIKYNADGNVQAMPQNIPFNTNFISSQLNDRTINGEMLEYTFRFRGKTHQHKLIYGKDQLFFNNGGNDVEPKITGFISTRIGSLNSETAKFYDNLKIKKIEKDVVKAVQIIEPEIRDIMTSGNKVYFDIGLDEYKPVEYFGDGVARLMYLVVSIAARKNGLLMIDEIERGFHYSIHDKVWEVVIKTAKANNCQLIITTHSYEILQSLVIAADDLKTDDITYFKLDNSAKSKRYSIQDLTIAISNNWEVR